MYEFRVKLNGPEPINASMIRVNATPERAQEAIRAAHYAGVKISLERTIARGKRLIYTVFG